MSSNRVTYSLVLNALFFANIDKRNFVYVQIDAIGVGLAASANPFLPIFLTRLEASSLEVGLLTAMPAVTGLLLAILSEVSYKSNAHHPLVQLFTSGCDCLLRINRSGRFSHSFGALTSIHSCDLGNCHHSPDDPCNHV